MSLRPFTFGPLGAQGLSSVLQDPAAMSRWHHGECFANSLRKAPAVMVPASRPPVFLRSADSPRMSSRYSSQSGSCQILSPVPLRPP